MRIYAYLLGLVLLAMPVAVSAQSIQTPYWCGSYWSSYPCNYQYPQYPYYPYYPYYPQVPTLPTPTCSITWNYASGSYWWWMQRPIVLSWSSANASSAYISGLGSVPLSGQQTVQPSGTTVYTMSVYNSGGGNTCQVTVPAQQQATPYYPYYPWYPWGY